MATNADESNDSTNTATEDQPVTEQDLRDLKYNQEDVETDKKEDETSTEEQQEAEGQDETEEQESDGQTTEDANETGEESEEDEQSESDTQPTFTKKFANIKGDTPEEYARNLEAAYENSTKEFHRLRDKAPPKSSEGEENLPNSPLELYMKQKMDEEIYGAFDDFSKTYPQVLDKSEYDKFTTEVDALSRTILTSQNRLASPKELYTKAAVILGWPAQDTVSDKDKLDVQLKHNAATSKTTSATKGKGQKSKVTDQMIAVNRMMYPDKSDTQIREELEAYVQ